MKVITWFRKRFDEFPYKYSVAWERHVESTKHADSLHFQVTTKDGNTIHVLLTASEPQPYR